MCKFCIMHYTRQYYNYGITIIFCFQTRPGIYRPATTKIKFECQNINAHIHHHQSSRTVGMNLEGQCMPMFSCMTSWLLYFRCIDPFWATHLLASLFSMHRSILGHAQSAHWWQAKSFFYGQWWEKQRSRTKSLWHSLHMKRHGILCTCHINKVLRSWPGKTWARFPYNPIH